MVAASEALVLPPVPAHITYSLYYLGEPSLTAIAMLIPVAGTMDTGTALTPGPNPRATSEPPTQTFAHRMETPIQENGLGSGV